MIGAVAAFLLTAAQAGAPALHNDMFGSFSPDGRRIAFMSDRSGDPEIYVAAIDGSGLSRLTFAAGRDAHPSFSPDGRLIAFQSPRGGNGDVRIYTMNADGSAQRLLVETTGFCGVPVWSPDGAHIVFQCSSDRDEPGSAPAPWRLFEVGADGSGLRTLTGGPGNDQVPSFSGAGRLLFHSNRSGSDQLYELEVASGRVEALTSGPEVHETPSAAPGGRRIALGRGSGAEGPADIAMLDRDTGAIRILHSPGWRYGAAQFAPDGRTILFQAPTPNGVRLFLMPSGGGAPVPFEPGAG